MKQKINGKSDQNRNVTEAVKIAVSKSTCVAALHISPQADANSTKHLLCQLHRSNEEQRTLLVGDFNARH